MKRVNNRLDIAGVVRLQEKIELLKRHRVDKATYEIYQNLMIALLWCITQENTKETQESCTVQQKERGANK